MTGMEILLDMELMTTLLTSEVATISVYITTAIRIIAANANSANHMSFLLGLHTTQINQKNILQGLITTKSKR